jgi:hypothetical protein
MSLVALFASLCSIASAGTGLSADLGIMAELPVSTGLQATVELPGRLRLGGSLGRLPGLIGSGATEASIGTGLLSEDEAALLGESLVGTWTVGASLGWRPFGGAGLWLAGDLRSLQLRAQASQELVVTALDVDPKGLEDATAGQHSQPVIEPLELALRATLLGGSLGWDWLLAERVTLRVSAGVLVLSSADAQVEAGERAAAVGPEQRLADEADAQLDSVLGERFVTPTLGLGLGWHFG